MVRALAPFLRRGCTFISGQADGPPFMMGGTDVLGFPMTPSSENSQKFIETIDEQVSSLRSIRM
jgi:hypothetical protein